MVQGRSSRNGTISNPRERYHPLRLGLNMWRWSTDTSILDFDPKSGRFASLPVPAETHRSQKWMAMNLSIQPALAEWGDYGLCALVGGKLMAFDARRQDWNVLLAATNCGEKFTQ